MSQLSTEFSAVSIVNNHVFSWVFIVDWILALALTIFMIFYFNRLVGWTVSFLVRWYLWRSHHAQLEIQSLQISLLGGRIFFKNLSYVGTNEAICILQGSFTWRYWLFHTRDSLLHRKLFNTGKNDQQKEKKADGTESGSSSGISGATETNIVPEETNKRHPSNHKRPARLVFDVTGVEWFVFNRTPAYDALLDLYKGKDHNSSASDSIENIRTSSSTASSDSSSTNDFSLLDSMFLRFLPIEVRCHNKGAMVIGNRDTPSLLILHFASGVCSVDATPSNSLLDKYKVIFKINMIKPILEMRANIDYKGPDTVGFSPVSPLSILKLLSWQSLISVLDRIKRFFTRKGKNKQKKQTKGRAKSRSSSRGRTTAHKPSFAEGIGRLMSQRSRSNMTTTSTTTSSSNDDYYYGENNDRDEDDEKPWRGLARYNIYYGQDDRTISDDIPHDQIVEEYGKYSVLLDATEGTITYYYDVPGKVPENIIPSPTDILGNGRIEGNDSGGDPGWGVDMSFTSCTIHYGPWADRQRVFIQNLLFPRSFVDSVPEPVRIEGQDRMGMEFKLFIEFNEDVIVRIPTREPSKNAQFYSSLKESPTTNSMRAFGWIELKARHLSTISFTAALVAGSNGWVNNFRMDLNHPELRTSVNHGLVFSAEHHTIQSTMTAPLKWNGLQLWNFQHNSEGVKTFFLREHVSLLTDLINDFASGPPVPYNQFIPFRYEIRWHISDYGIFLNVNDRNIINNPSDFDDNTFVSFQGQTINIDIILPMEQASVLKNRLDFKIRVSKSETHHLVNTNSLSHQLLTL